MQRVITISRQSISGQDTDGAPSAAQRYSFSVPEDGGEAGFGGSRDEIRVPLLNGQEAPVSTPDPEPESRLKPDGEHDSKAADRADEDVRMKFAINASLVRLLDLCPSPLSWTCALSSCLVGVQVANILLLIVKAFAVWYSHSQAVLASTADSFVDIASQVRTSVLMLDPLLSARLMCVKQSEHASPPSESPWTCISCCCRVSWTISDSRCVQVVIAFAEHKMRAADPRSDNSKARSDLKTTLQLKQGVLTLSERRYPVGQARMETVGVVACAVIMTL